MRVRKINVNLCFFTDDQWSPLQKQPQMMSNVFYAGALQISKNLLQDWRKDGIIFKVNAYD